MTDQNPQLEDTTTFPTPDAAVDPQPTTLPDDGSGAMFTVAREHADRNEIPAAVAAYSWSFGTRPTTWLVALRAASSPATCVP